MKGCRAYVLLRWRHSRSSNTWPLADLAEMLSASCHARFARDWPQEAKRQRGDAADGAGRMTIMMPKATLFSRVARSMIDAISLSFTAASGIYILRDAFKSLAAGRMIHAPPAAARVSSGALLLSALASRHSARGAEDDVEHIHSGPLTSDETRISSHRCGGEAAFFSPRFFFLHNGFIYMITIRAQARGSRPRPSGVEARIDRASPFALGRRCDAA